MILYSSGTIPGKHRGLTSVSQESSISFNRIYQSRAVLKPSIEIIHNP